jgi:hypothetical protein
MPPLFDRHRDDGADRPEPTIPELMVPELMVQQLMIQEPGVMATVIFTANVQRHVLCPRAEASGRTLREVLDSVFAGNAQARAYVLDDQSALRQHMSIFVDGRLVRDRAGLSDAVGESSTVYVFQALSGG